MTDAMTTIRGQGRAIGIACLLAAANASAAVTELKPQEVAAFVARYPVAVIQFTSPDRGCSYCTGADKTFDETAAQPSLQGIRFARVQWAPWRPFPNFGELPTVYGIPEHHVFKEGRGVGSAGGRPSDAGQLMAKIEALVAAQPATEPDVQPAAPPQPLSAEQGEDIRLGVRHTVMQAVTRACGQRFAAQAGRWQAQFAGWTTQHRQALDRNARLMLQRTAPGEDKALRQLQQDEQSALQSWQVQQLGIAMNAPPREQDCQRMLDGLSAGAQGATRQNETP